MAFMACATALVGAGKHPRRISMRALPLCTLPILELFQLLISLLGEYKLYVAKSVYSPMTLYQFLKV